MRKKSDEFKVGIMIIIFALLGFFILYFMGEIKRETGTTLVVQFEQVGGISKGDAVRYAGVTIGKVKKVEIKTAKMWDWDKKKDEFVPRIGPNGSQMEGEQAFVTILITNLDVFKDRNPGFSNKTQISIATSIMNEKWIEITPRPGTPLKKDEILMGHSTITIEQFISKAQDAVEKLGSAADSVNQVLGDPELQSDVKMSMRNFKDLTANLREASNTANEKIRVIAGKIENLTDNANIMILNINRQVDAAGANVQAFTASLKRMSTHNEGDLRIMVKNLVQTSKSLRNTLDVIEQLVTDKEFSENIRTTLKNIKNTSEQIEGIANDVRAITSDGQIREDLKVAVSEARGAATQANSLLKGVNNYLGTSPDTGNSDKSQDKNTKSNEKGKKVNLRRHILELEAEAEYDTGSKKTFPNINALILPEGKSSVKIGVDSAGVENLFNLQYRAKMGSFYPRIGVVRSKVGAGFDYNINKTFGVNVDAYNPDNWQVDMTGRITVADDFYIHGGVRDVFDRKTTVFGVGKKF